MIKKCLKTVLERIIGKEFKYCTKVRDYDIISIDMFDTLVYRTVKDPKDVFDMIWPKNKEFKEVRIKAEKTARKKKDKDDITIDDIYDVIATHYGEEKAAELKTREIQIEYEITYGNPEALCFFRYLKQKGKRIIVTSDMYMHRELLERILLKCGYEGLDKVYVSGELGITKRTGELYEYLCKEWNTSRILHIGDNLISDYYSAYKNGITAFLYKAKQ